MKNYQIVYVYNGISNPLESKTYKTKEKADKALEHWRETAMALAERVAFSYYRDFI